MIQFVLEVCAMYRRIDLPVVLAVFMLTALSAGVPALISHQGRLLDDAGQPVADALYSMEFRIYDACSGGNLLLTDSHDVETRNGIYSVLLGGGTLTPGIESGLLGVFENHSMVCLGTTVGTDSEMQPRQQIVSAGFALKSATTEVLGQINVRKGNGVYYCSADWDDNGSAGDSADVVACLQSALADIRENNDGTDNALTVRLPSGRFDVSPACADGACFRLKSGIRIVGEMPRLRHFPGEPPDLNMAPNGGTWLDPGPANTLFVGQHLRGVSLERFGVTNFGRIAAFGGDDEGGIAFSTIRDVYGVGTSRHETPRSTDAFLFYNIQHLRMDHVKLYFVERGLYIIAQHTEWQPANSVISDFYVRTYPDPQGGIRLETLEPSSGTGSWMMNYMTFVRPQVNAFNSTGAPGSTGIWLKGFSPSRPVQTNWIIGADVEGEYEVAIRLENASRNRIEVAGVTSPTVGLSLDAESRFNVITSVHDALTVSVASERKNMFLGQFEPLDDTNWRGLYHDRLTNEWSVALGSGGRVVLGDGYAWYDEVGNDWRVKDGAPASSGDGVPLVTGTGSSASRGPVLWADVNTSCAAACADAGMEECVNAWADGAAVGCAEVVAQRLCACR